MCDNAKIGYSPDVAKGGVSSRYQPPTILERLQKASLHNSQQQELFHRIQAILSAHPEFAEFLELQRLISEVNY